MEEQRQLEEEWSKRRRPQDVSGSDTSCTGSCCRAEPLDWDQGRRPRSKVQGEEEEVIFSGEGAVWRRRSQRSQRRELSEELNVEGANHSWICHCREIRGPR
jgi:hypothetical protein